MLCRSSQLEGRRRKRERESSDLADPNSCFPLSQRRRRIHSGLLDSFLSLYVLSLLPSFPSFPFSPCPKLSRLPSLPSSSKLARPFPTFAPADFLPSFLSFQQPSVGYQTSSTECWTRNECRERIVHPSSSSETSVTVDKPIEKCRSTVVDNKRSILERMLSLRFVTLFQLCCLSALGPLLELRVPRELSKARAHRFPFLPSDLTFLLRFPSTHPTSPSHFNPTHPSPSQVSARTNYGVENGFRSLVRLMSDRKNGSPPNTSNGSAHGNGGAMKEYGGGGGNSSQGGGSGGGGGGQRRKKKKRNCVIL